MKYASKGNTRIHQVPKVVKVAGCTVVIWVMFNLAFHSASNLVAIKYPFWAWENGTSAMQQTAISEIVARISPGEKIDSVMEQLGPGSVGWPERYDSYTNLGSADAEIMFGVRSEGNIGIIIRIRDRKVQEVRSYN